MWRNVLYGFLVAMTCGMFVACSDNSGPVGPGDNDPIVYDTPDAVIEAFTDIWNDMDFPEYRDYLLYDGETPAADRETYTAFKFYFIVPDDQYGASWGFAEEKEHTERLFSGSDALDGSPGVKTITLHLSPITTWEAPANPYEVEGDTYPEGTQVRRYQTDLSIELKGTNNDGYSGYEVNDHVDFFVIPVDVDGSTEYRLWKWRDIGNGFLRTEDSSWSSVKALY